MTDIFPAPDQRIGEITAELEELGLSPETDFWMHFSWDLRPFVQCTPAAYKTWATAHGAAEGDEDEDSGDADEGDGDGEGEQSEDDSDSDADSDTDDTKAQSSSRRRATRRR